MDHHTLHTNVIAEDLSPKLWALIFGYNSFKFVKDLCCRALVRLDTDVGLKVGLQFAFTFIKKVEEVEVRTQKKREKHFFMDLALCTGYCHVETMVNFHIGLRLKTM